MKTTIQLPTPLEKRTVHAKHGLTGRDFHTEPSIREPLYNTLYDTFISNLKRGLIITGIGLTFLAGFLCEKWGKKLAEYEAKHPLPAETQFYDPNQAYQTQEQTPNLDKLLE